MGETPTRHLGDVANNIANQSFTFETSYRGRTSRFFGLRPLDGWSDREARWIETGKDRKEVLTWVPGTAEGRLF